MFTNSFGQKLPIGSKDELRTYALEQSRSVSVSVGTQLPAGTNSYKYVQLESSTMACISNTILKTKLVLDIVNPKDSFYIWVYVSNSDGFPLFTGMNQFNLVQTNGAYSVPTGYGNVVLDLYENIPLPIDGGAQWAEVAFIGADGKTYNFSSLQVWDNKLLFPRQLAGTNAFLVVGTASGGIKYWNVSNGQVLDPQEFDVLPSVIIRGIVPIMDGNIVVTVPTTNGVGQNLSVEYTSTKSQLVAISFYTSEWKWCKTVKIRKAGEKDWTTYSLILDSTGEYYYVNLQFDVGVYYVVPVWDPADISGLPDPWYPPYYYDGGGKG
jgi:hypothetical protein